MKATTYTAGIAAGIAALLILTGCTATSTASGLESAPSVGIVVGNTAYASSISRSSFAAVLKQTVNPGTELSVYSSEGTPRQLWEGPVTWDQSAQQVDSSYAKALGKVEAAVLDKPAVTPESNPLEAVLQIAGGFSGRKGPKEIVILDPLLQTSGAIALQDGTLSGEPSDTVAYLRSTRYLTNDLKGYRIVLADIGEVPTPSKQPAFDSLSRKRLLEFWTVIFRSAGAQVTTTSLSFGAPAKTAEPVTTISVTPVQPPVVDCSLSLDGTEVGFEPDTAVFLDRAASIATLSAAADRLKAAGCSGQVTLTGTTSSAGTSTSRAQVATARVLAVRTLLASHLGIAQSAIHTNAVGYDLNYCAKDTNDKGQLVPALASRCRLVVLSIG